MVTKKAKAKEWFSIVAPKIFGEREIGKTLVSDREKLVGRKITLNLIELTGNFNKYYMKFVFKINKIDGNQAFSEFNGSECLRDYISRMVVRRVRRVDTVQDLETKDRVKIRVKGVAVLPRRVKSTIQTTIRNRIKEIVKSEVENSTLDQLLERIISDEMKNKILQNARRIYPVRNFEIRKTEIISS